MNESIAGLKATSDINSTIQIGTSLPAFKLPNALGNEVLITFYRGDWCPYCNLALRSLQLHLDAFHAKGVTMGAISPELPNTSLSTTEKNELKFEVLSDVGNKFARQLGIVWDQPRSLGRVFETFRGVVRNIHIDPDYRQRLETTTALAWVDAL
ncbi:thioredoxin-like protein [Trichoderma austrokoningii]